MLVRALFAAVVLSQGSTDSGPQASSASVPGDSRSVQESRKTEASAQGSSIGGRKKSGVTQGGNSGTSAVSNNSLNSAFQRFNQDSWPSDEASTISELTMPSGLNSGLPPPSDNHEHASVSKNHYMIMNPLIWKLAQIFRAIKQRGPATLQFHKEGAHLLPSTTSPLREEIHKKSFGVKVTPIPAFQQENRME